MLKDLKFTNNIPNDNQTNVDDSFAENQFQNVIKNFAVNLLHISSTRDTKEKFELVNENSESAKLISLIVSEKIEEILKSSLQISRLLAAPDKFQTRSGTWDSVLGAATLVNTPPR